MKIIVPLEITDTNLTASNVPENDYTAWSAVTAYVVGNNVMYDHRNYECLINNTNVQPDTGALLVPPKWLDLGANNRYRMFDRIVGAQTSKANTIEVTITPAEVVNGIAFFNTFGGTVQVQVDDPVYGIVYDRTINLMSAGGSSNWYEFFFGESDTANDVVFLDVPSYANADIIITIDAGSGTASCGECVLGRQNNIGVTNFGSRFGIQDYSVVTTDAFGNRVITERGFNKIGDYDVTVETDRIGTLQRKLASIRATPVVFIGDEDRDETIIFGLLKTFSFNENSPSISPLSMEVHGLT